MEIFLLFSRALSFLTIFAEGVFIIAFLRVLSAPGVLGKNRPLRNFVPATLFLLLFLLLFAGEYLCGLMIELDQGFHRLIYRVVVWDFVATLYVLLEGIIFILACKLYKTINQRACGTIKGNYKYGPGRTGTVAICLVAVVFLAGFVFFEYGAVHTAIDNRLPPQSILNMAFFYRLITGWLWTFFEAVLAFILIKLFLLMKHGEEKCHAGH